MSCPRPQRFLGTRLHPLLDLPHSARAQYVASASRLLSQHLRRRTPGVTAPEHVVCLIFLFGSLTCRASATGRDVEYCQSFFQNVTLKSVNGLLFPFLMLLSPPLPNTVRYALAGQPASPESENLRTTVRQQGVTQPRAHCCSTSHGSCLVALVPSLVIRLRVQRWVFCAITFGMCSTVSNPTLQCHVTS